MLRIENDQWFDPFAAEGMVQGLWFRLLRCRADRDMEPLREFLSPGLYASECAALLEDAKAGRVRYADDPDSDAPYFLCKELQEGFLDGITGSYHDPEPYFVAMRNPEAFEKYDKKFPQKEKLVLPGQLG